MHLHKNTLNNNLSGIIQKHATKNQQKKNNNINMIIEICMYEYML